MIKLKKPYLYLIAVSIIAIIGVAVLTMNSQTTLVPEKLEKKTIVADGILQPFSVDDLAKRSQYQIIGQVESITPTSAMTDEKHSVTRVFSDVVIKVEKDLSGRYTNDKISVRIMGGETNTIKMISEMDAEFSVGERVLVFVADKEPKSIWGNNYYIAGLKLGTYDLVDGKAIGPEYPRGIKENQLITKIQQAKTNP